MTEIIWRPKEFRTGLVDGLDLAFPVGLDTEMYFHSSDDEDGNAIMDQVGKIVFKDDSKKEYEVFYDPDYEGPRENESEGSKKSREQYLESRSEDAATEETAEETVEEPAAEAETEGEEAAADGE